MTRSSNASTDVVDVLVSAPSPVRMTDGLRAAAMLAPGGWMYLVDRHFAPDPGVPVRAVVGAWRVDEAGVATAEYRDNPDYSPSPMSRGWPAPCDDLDATAQLAAAGYATPDDVIVAVLYDDVFYALADGGAPLLDDEGRLVAYSVGTARPDVSAGGSWHRSSGRELAVRNAANAAILLNPGAWQASIPAVELAARAGGEASGYLLAQSMDDFLAGDLDAGGLHRAFCGAQVFCQASEHPGFCSIGDGGEAVVPVFTSLVALARVAGQTAWFSSLGQDVLNLLPDGYDVVVDPGTPRAVRLRGDATARCDA